MLKGRGAREPTIKEMSPCVSVRKSIGVAAYSCTTVWWPPALYLFVRKMLLHTCALSRLTCGFRPCVLARWTCPWGTHGTCLPTCRMNWLPMGWGLCLTLSGAPWFSCKSRSCDFWGHVFNLAHISVATLKQDTDALQLWTIDLKQHLVLNILDPVPIVPANSKSPFSTGAMPHPIRSCTDFLEMYLQAKVCLPKRSNILLHTQARQLVGLKISGCSLRLSVVDRRGTLGKVAKNTLYPLAWFTTFGINMAGQLSPAHIPF